MTQTTATAAPIAPAAEAARNALGFALRAQAITATGGTVSDGLRKAVLAWTGREADALRPFDAYAATYARQYVGSLIAAGRWDVVVERFARHTA